MTPTKTETPRKTLREAIREGLRKDWTQAREDRMFWPVAEFMHRACENVRQQVKKDILDKLKERDW